MFEGRSQSDWKKLFQDNYAEVTGRHSDGYFCPILQVAAQTDLIGGHIIPQSQAVTNLRIPQRKDVDEFYGTAFEADFEVATKMILDEVGFSDIIAGTIPRAPKPTFRIGETDFEFYFPKEGTSLPEGHSMARLVTEENEQDIAVKLSPKQILALNDTVINTTVEHDAIPEVTATVLKAAHLSLFAMQGYQYLYTAAGQMLADILKRPFQLCDGRRPARIKEDLRECFAAHANMIKPMVGTAFEGSIIDGFFLLCLGTTTPCFSFAVLVPMRRQLFAVFLPTPNYDPGLENYHSFLRNPPTSINTSFMKFVADNTGNIFRGLECRPPRASHQNALTPRIITLEPERPRWKSRNEWKKQFLFSALDSLWMPEVHHKKNYWRGS